MEKSFPLHPIVFEMVTPLFPEREASSLDSPTEEKSFMEFFRKTGLLHGPSPDEGASTRGTHAIRFENFTLGYFTESVFL